VFVITGTDFDPKNPTPSTNDAPKPDSKVPKKPDVKGGTGNKPAPKKP
jgi:hypothetical protein